MQIEASVAEFARRRTPLKASEAKLLKTVAQVFSPASLRRDDLLLASHGLNRKTLFTERLTDEQELVFWQTPIEGAITPRICRAADMPHSVLHVAAKMMLARDPSGKTLTAANLARELKLSRATLYRHFAPEKIRQALELNFAANELAKTSGELPMRRRISESRS
jgi:AraC-like DNA-binding protein